MKLKNNILTNIYLIEEKYCYYKIITGKQNLMTAETGKELMQDMINRTISSQGNWGKHVSHSCCKCQKCTCGKHKCEIKSPHLGLSPSNSTYNKQYQKRRPLVQSTPKKANNYESYEPRQLISKSQYRDQYVDKLQNSPKIKLEIHPDNIETGGPSFNQTTYLRSFKPSNCERAEQIKNPETLGCTPGAKMKANSSYRETYKWHLNPYIKKEKPIKHSDNLKTEPSIFTAKSRYSTDFKQFVNYKRDKSNFAPDRSFIPEKALKTQTSYNEHYATKKMQRCPAEGLN